MTTPDQALIDAIGLLIYKHETFGDYRGPLETVLAIALVNQELADHGVVYAEQWGDPASAGWCPVHGSAACPEQYMLAPDGRPWIGYRDDWSEDMRCGQRQPLYRLKETET